MTVSAERRSISGKEGWDAMNIGGKRLLEAILTARGAAPTKHEVKPTVSAFVDVSLFVPIGPDEATIALHASAMLEFHNRRVEAAFQSLEFREEPPRVTAFQQSRFSTPGF